MGWHEVVIRTYSKMALQNQRKANVSSEIFICDQIRVEYNWIECFFSVVELYYKLIFVTLFRLLFVL